MDAQLPPGLVRMLFDRFPPNVSDVEIWQHASLSCSGIIVSKDEDFPQCVFAAETAPQVLWLRVGNTSNRALFEWLQPIWPSIERSLQAGEKLVEVI
jgi:predicted nuclease of predicted toxin-antitoxin system